MSEQRRGTVVARASNGNTPNRPRMVTARERDRQALELRMQGLTFDAIGVQIGVTREAARKAVARSLDITRAAISEAAEELRGIEAERLEKITEVLWPRVLEGDLRAIDRVLRTRESFRRLIGIDLSQEAAGASVGDTYVLVDGDMSRVPSGGRLIDARLPHLRGRITDERLAIDGEIADPAALPPGEG